MPAPLLEHRSPVVIRLNMLDMAENHGIRIQTLAKVNAVDVI
ncbi:hypothetical protein HCJ54_06485 [Listeria grandensis]|nr:hypothetical protein [Listeria grandensis]